MRAIRVFLLSLVLTHVFISDSAAQAGEIRIGVLTDLSGSLAPIGLQCQQGAEAARVVYEKSGRLTGRKVKLFFADHQATPRVGISEFRRLVSAHDIHLLISNRSPVAIAINPISEKAGIPYLGVVSHIDFLKTNHLALRVWPSGLREGQALGKKALKLGAKKAAVLSWEDDWALAIERSFVETFEKGGGQIVYRETVLDNERDLKPYVTKLAHEKPDAVLANLGINQAPSFYKRFHERGVPATVFSNFLSSLAQVKKAAGLEAIEGVIIAQLDRRKPVFMKQYQKLFGGALPPPMSYGCYAATAAALSAYEKLSGKVSSDALSRVLLGASEATLPDGPVAIKDRELQLGLVLTQIQNGKEVVVLGSGTGLGKVMPGHQ